MVLLNNNAERKGLWMQNLVWSCIESGKRETASLGLEEVEYSCIYFITPVVWKMEKKYYSEQYWFVPILYLIFFPGISR